MKRPRLATLLASACLISLASSGTSAQSFPSPLRGLTETLVMVIVTVPDNNQLERRIQRKLADAGLRAVAVQDLDPKAHLDPERNEPPSPAARLSVDNRGGKLTVKLLEGLRLTRPPHTVWNLAVWQDSTPTRPDSTSRELHALAVDLVDRFIDEWKAANQSRTE